MIQRRLLFLRKYSLLFKQFVAYVKGDGGVVESVDYLYSKFTQAPNASILQIPTSYKTSVLYNQEPFNPSEDFDVIRNSTVTRVAPNGLLEEIGVNVPCIDYETGEPLLLTQPQSTNLEIQSQSFEGYSGNNKVVTDNATTSPKGTISGAILADDNSGGTNTVQLIANYTVSTSSTYTYSIFAKKKDLDFLSLRLSNFTTPSNDSSYFDLNLGVVVSEGAGQTAKIKNYGNGWFRCSITFTTDSVDNFGAVLVRLSQNGIDTIVNINNTSNIYIWGAQMENQPFATSYIETNGSVATRLRDEILNAGSTDTINSQEGVFYFKGSMANITSKDISLNDGSSGNRIMMRFETDTFGGKGRFRILYTTNNVQQRSLATVEDEINIFEINEYACVYNQDDASLYVNGNILDSGSIANPIPASTLNKLSFDNNSSGGRPFAGKTKELRVYKSIAQAQIDLPYIT